MIMKVKVFKIAFTIPLETICLWIPKYSLVLELIDIFEGL